MQQRWLDFCALAQVRMPQAVQQQGAAALTAGSIGQRVLALMAERPQKFWARRELLAALEPPRAVSWALVRAQHMGWIEAAGDVRNVRYRRYRITAAGVRKLGEVGR